jgi:hypothetical protein
MNISWLRIRIVRTAELDRLRAAPAAAQASAQAQVEQLTAHSRAVQAELAATCGRLEAAERERSGVQDELYAVRSELREVKSKLEGATRPPPRGQPGQPGQDSRPPPVVPELVGLVEKLAEMTGGAAPDGSGPAVAALRWVKQSVQTLLPLCDVEQIVDSGCFDLRRHEVVADRTAPNQELVDHIADTVRPGYAWRGSVLRPQQVVVFVPAGEAADP